MSAAAIEAPFDVGRAWRHVRWPVALGVLLLVAAFVLAIVRNAPPQRSLDPTDASPIGARALAQLLEDRGIHVTGVGSVSALNADAQTTVFLPDPTAISETALRRLAASAADIVVIDPQPRDLGGLGIDATPTGDRSAQTSSPQCSLPLALAAGSVRVGGTVYDPGGSSTGCYGDSDKAALVVAARTSGAHTVVLGSRRTLSNSWLADEGDAALGLGLLGARPELQWLLPQPATRGSADGDHKSLIALLPDRLLWAVLMLAVAVVLVGLWRGRRLGPVVAEPLPVVVRALETVEGRAGLLRAARARGSAAAALRAATAARLRDLLRLGADAPASVVVEAVARRTGRNAADISGLLQDTTPPNDATLVRLANELDALEQSVRRS